MRVCKSNHVRKIRKLKYYYPKSYQSKVKGRWIIAIPVSAGNVSLEVVPLVAPMGTVGAGVGLLPGVSPLVPLQLVPGLERLAADEAGVVAAAPGRGRGGSGAAAAAAPRLNQLWGQTL